MAVTVMVRYRMLGEPQIATRIYDNVTEAADALNTAPKIVYSASCSSGNDVEHRELFRLLGRFGRWYRNGDSQSEIQLQEDLS